MAKIDKRCELKFVTTNRWQCLNCGTECSPHEPKG